MKDELAIGAAGLVLALGVAACGSSGSPAEHNASYQAGFKMGKESKWYGQDECTMLAPNEKFSGLDPASWLQGCEDGLKQATP